MTFNDPPKSKPGATEQEQVYDLYKYLLETSAKLNLLQEELSASLTASGASGSGGDTVVDAALSDTSANPVRNSAVTAALAACAKTDDLDAYAKTSALAAYLPLTGGTLTGSVVVDGSGKALAHQWTDSDGKVCKVYVQAAYYTDGTTGAQLVYQKDGTVVNQMRLYPDKTVLSQDLEDANGVPYVKEVTGTWTPNLIYYNLSAGSRTAFPSSAYAYRYGYYAKIGNLVYIVAHIKGTIPSAAAGYYIEASLPFTAASEFDQGLYGCCLLNISASAPWPILTTTEGAYNYVHASTAATFGGTMAKWGASGTTFWFHFSGVYRAAD